MGIKRVFLLISAFLYIFSLLLILLAKLLGIWLVLDWKIWRVKKNFEREIVKYGVSRDEARKLSAQYNLIGRNLKRSLLKGKLKFN